MRTAICVAALLALAGCGEDTGWNPNYTAGPRPYGVISERAPYATYKADRELALAGQKPASKVIPGALPVRAPTPAEIAGPNLWQIIQGQARGLTGGGVAAGGAVTPEGAALLERYAGSIGHAPGQAVFARAAGRDGSQRFCRSFASTDAAQIAFLSAGGPQADPSGVDPDGDGYVCGWNPAPWRRTAGL